MNNTTSNTITPSHVPSSHAASNDAAQVSESKHWKNLQPKDWISVGVYAVVYFVLVYAFGMIGYIPFVYPFCGLLYGLFCQIPVLLLATKVRHFGALTLLGTLCGLVSGLELPSMIPAGIICGLLADLIAMRGSYRNKTTLMLSTGMLNLMWFGGSYILIYMNRSSMLGQISQGYGADYANTVSALLPQWTAVALPIAMFIAGCIGGWLALKVMRKHFERAGLV
ncbi:MptD family putative ECF transporter S component [Bifidobacterium mongoliense]|uniref:MptD family putative ECF transporter S component n=1 Tax=Bifidobacterium mongoliense TaxID=518643 RepID=UPI0030EC003A